MAAPLVLSFWMRAAVTFVDTIFASRLGDAAVAAIGLTVPLEFVMIGVWVGLSTGLTSQLSDGGRWLLIVLMLIGRLGPISLFVAVSRVRRDQRLAYAKEDVLIG